MRCRNRAIGCAIEVHRTLGPGLIESVYRRCLEHELRAAGLAFEAEKSIQIQYKAIRLEDPGLRLDMVVEKG